jgi:hypothetical protein
MKRVLLVALLPLAACSKGPDVDLQYVGEARSLAAEWAMVNQLGAQGRTNPTYTDAMRRQLREQLQSAASALTHPDSRYGKEIRALLMEPADAAPDELRAHSDKLKQIEDGLESA